MENFRVILTLMRVILIQKLTTVLSLFKLRKPRYYIILSLSTIMSNLLSTVFDSFIQPLIALFLYIVLLASVTKAYLSFLRYIFQSIKDRVGLTTDV